MEVRKTKLTKLTFLAKGGFGQVYRVEGFTLPGDKTALAYKEFTAEHAAQGRSAEAAVAFRDGLPAADRAELDFYCAWPRAIVTDGPGTTSGLLMPLIPEEFFCELADPDSPSGQMTSKPREMGWLITSAAQRQAARIDLGEVAIGRLHRHGWVFGDLSFKNAVFAVDPPRVMLLDCDGAADRNDDARKQSSTPYWDPPECPINPPPGQRRQQDLQDTVTDVYKLGLAILRCLTPGKGSSMARSSGRLDHELDPAGKMLVDRALSADRATRPTARELYAYLYGVAAPRTADPEIQMARLARRVVLSGLDARIEWQISHADQVTVSAGANFSTQVDPAAYPRGFTFRVRESGPVRVEAGNRFGSVTADLGELTVYELPPFKVSCDFLPQPRVPALRAFSLEPVTKVLASRPDPGGHLPEMPPVPSLSSYAFVEGLRPGRTSVTWSGIGETITEAADAIRAQVLDTTYRHLAARQGDGT
jgi:hypothetical protein